MSVLTLAPRHWYSWNFSVADGDRPLAEFNLSSWREKGVVWVDGVDYRLYRESPLGDFVLQHAGSVIARATKPSAFRREFVVRYRERPYTLRAKGALRRTEDWPLPLKLFAMWLTIVHWKRDAS